MTVMLNEIQSHYKIAAEGDAGTLKQVKAINPGKILFLRPLSVTLNISLPGHFSSWDPVLKYQLVL